MQFTLTDSCSSSARNTLALNWAWKKNPHGSLNDINIQTLTDSLEHAMTLNCWPYSTKFNVSIVCYYGIGMDILVSLTLSLHDKYHDVWLGFLLKISINTPAERLLKQKFFVDLNSRVRFEFM